MTLTNDRSVPSDVVDTFDSLDPSTDEVMGTFPVDGQVEVARAVEQAREAADWWADLGFAGRRERLKAWKGVIAREAMDLAELVHRENGKPVADGLLEITLAVDHIEWSSKRARRVLGPRHVASGMTALNQAASLEYAPLGVVGVIGPWNYPVFTPMGSLAYALAAGNAVVFKPSEYTPAVGHWLVEAFRRAVPEHPVLSLVTGGAATGEALCRSGVAKIAFTGSARTGRKILAACADTLTPVLMECGGKDAMVVDADADIDAAADAAVWGGMSNAGQTCIGIERVYVAEPAFDRFVAAVQQKVTGVRPGSDGAASYGPITMPGQVDIIERHVGDALDRGATAVVGGRESIRRPYVEPVVLLDVPDDALAVTEETFGPTLVIERVRDADEGVDRSNASRYGLAGAVYTGSRKRGMELARRMRTGMTSVNAVIAFASVPSLPFGGVGESGFGRIHGEDGLREFARAKAITRQRFALPVPLLSFSRPAAVTPALGRALVFLHGRTKLKPPVVGGR
jgi:acyl-CoA reductase-like NAD-dependent aldehyde dehydrogenase